MLFMCSKHLHSGDVTVILSTCCVGYTGLCKVKKKFKNPNIIWKLVGGSRSHLDKKKLENCPKSSFASVQFAPALRCTWRIKVRMLAAFYPVFCDFVIVYCSSVD